MKQINPSRQSHSAILRECSFVVQQARIPTFLRANKEVDKNMIQRISLLAVCGLTFGLTAPSGWAETGDPAKGKAIYERLCGVCHGHKGKGDGPAGQMMKPSAADLTGSKLKDKPDAELFQTIQNGRPPTAMPAFKGQLSDQQIHDVVAYIRSLGK